MILIIIKMENQNRWCDWLVWEALWKEKLNKKLRKKIEK